MMEPAAHWLDRHAMLAEHIAVAERNDREVKAMVQVAEQKRRVHSDRFIEGLRLEIQAQSARVARTTPPQPATEKTARPMPLEPERPLPLESERLALAEMEARRQSLERYAEELLAETVRVEARMQERQAQAEREAEGILASARAEAQQIAAQIEARGEQVAREEIQIQIQEQRRALVAREAQETRAQGSDADHIVRVSKEQVHRMQKLLMEQLASLRERGAPRL